MQMNNPSMQKDLQYFCAEVVRPLLIDFTVVSPIFKSDFPEHDSFGNNVLTPIIVSYKRTAEDDAFAGSFNISGEPDFDGMTTESVRLNDYVACRYDEKWWISVVEEVDRVE